MRRNKEDKNVRNWIGVVLCFLISLFTNCDTAKETSDSILVEMSASKAKEWIDMTSSNPNRQILDVRTPDEFGSGHIEGARNLDIFHPDFSHWLESWNRDDLILVYCRSGNRSRSAITTMKGMGFTRIYHLTHGIQGWIRSGFPIQE